MGSGAPFGGRWCTFDGDLANSDRLEERGLTQHPSSASHAAVSLRGGVPDRSGAAGERNV